MKKLFIPEKVVFYIEPDEKIGTIHNLINNEKAYVNSDMVEIIQHLLQGFSLSSFFPKEVPHKNKLIFIKQSELIIDSLVRKKFLSKTSVTHEGLVKKVQTNPPLRVVFIEMTKKCNLRCGHCYVPDCSDHVKSVDSKQLNFIKLSGLVQQVDDLGVMEIQLTGGEPFVLPYTLDIIKKIQMKLIPCSIFTNGTMMTDDVFRYVSKNSHGLIFYISLDGYQETHDKFRGKAGSFQKATQTVRRLIKSGCDVRINTSVGRHNLLEMRQFIEFIKNEFGIMHRLVTVEPIGRANNMMTIKPGEFASLLKDSNNSFEFLDSHDSNIDWSTPVCGIGSSMLFIDAYGNVSFCPTLTQREDASLLAGNINNSSLKDIWESSSVFGKFRRLQCTEIETCEFKELCKGGCRSRAYLSTGDINSPDQAMCLLYGKETNKPNHL